jgi:hypothetical protein
MTARSIQGESMRHRNIELILNHSCHEIDVPAAVVGRRATSKLFQSQPSPQEMLVHSQAGKMKAEMKRIAYHDLRLTGAIKMILVFWAPRRRETMEGEARLAEEELLAKVSL